MPQLFPVEISWLPVIHSWLPVIPATGSFLFTIVFLLDRSLEEKGLFHH